MCWCNPALRTPVCKSPNCRPAYDAMAAAEDRALMDPHGEMALRKEAAFRKLPYVEFDPFQDPRGMKARQAVEEAEKMRQFAMAAADAREFALGQCGAAVMNKSSDSISALLSDSLAGVEELVRRLRSAANKQSGPVPAAVQSAPCKLDVEPSTLDLCWRLRVAVSDAHEEAGRIERSL